ncbi:hypothetical protein HY477_00685 [Candidatus Uhrbacteria bacterium]|nr:hypothetical protein [Candidatus Uhrbacteria bacterium]
MGNTKITSYHDLDVYQRSYKASILMMTKIIPRLPEVEKYDLKDQLCEQLIREYDIIGKQLFRLEQAWNKFSKRPMTSTYTQTGSQDHKPLPKNA